MKYNVDYLFKMKCVSCKRRILGHLSKASDISTASDLCCGICPCNKSFINFFDGKINFISFKIDNLTIDYFFGNKVFAVFSNNNQILFKEVDISFDTLEEYCEFINNKIIENMMFS